MKNPLRSICVFCGSADGVAEKYTNAAWHTGRLLAQKGMTLVYGAGRTGLMGKLAEGALQAGGTVIGVVPVGLESPQLINTTSLTKLEIVEDIQKRKARMIELSDAFIALPGGFGTLDEMFEVLTWSQIGKHRKPCGFLNVDGYFDLLIQWIERAYRERFIYQEHLHLFVQDDDPSQLVEKLASFQFPANLERWLVREE